MLPQRLINEITNFVKTVLASVKEEAPVEVPTSASTKDTTKKIDLRQAYFPEVPKKPIGNDVYASTFSKDPARKVGNAR